MDNTNIPLGLALGLTSGIFLGSFALPAKKIQDWQWENYWLTYTFWAAVIFPVILAVITIPSLLLVYLSVPIYTIITVLLFGAGWGIANIGFGLGVKYLGLALTTAILLGLTNVFGSILPLIFYHPEKFFAPLGIALSAGVAVMIAGIAVCAVAGARKDKALKRNARY